MRNTYFFDDSGHNFVNFWFNIFDTLIHNILIPGAQNFEICCHKHLQSPNYTPWGVFLAINFFKILDIPHTKAFTLLDFFKKVQTFLSQF